MPVAASLPFDMSDWATWLTLGVGLAVTLVGDTKGTRLD